VLRLIAKGEHSFTFVQISIELMKGKALRKHSLHDKTAASGFLSCSSVVMNDATPLTPPSA